MSARNLVPTAILIATSALTTACGGSDESPGNPASGGSAGSSGGSGGAGATGASGGASGGAAGAGGGGAVDWGDAALPCNIKSGYPGDELCILPPPADKGFQMHYGPSNYDDPAEVAKYTLAPGGETTDCIFMDLPNDQEVYFNEYHGRMRPNSHHMLLYVEDGDKPNSTEPGPCNQGTSTRNIFGAQEMVTDVKGGESKAPENVGLAVMLKPHLQGVVQVHFVNTSATETILRETWANVVYIDKSEVKQLGDPIFFIGGAFTTIPAHSDHVTVAHATVPSMAGAEGIRLVIGTGHYHAHTIRFSAWKTVGGVKESLFEDYDWHDPALMRFDSVKKNDTPDAEAGVAGGYSGIVQLYPGDRIDWECEVHNDSDIPLSFGNAVYEAEMCNMFGLYAPSFGDAWGATNF